ncbi:MAG: alpha-E domain-containing protein, partial [Pseudomonadota bacterium]
MLGKTANGLYWMFRSLERAENNARLIGTGQRIALTRSGAPTDEWTPVMQTTGTDLSYAQNYDTVTKESAIDWMLRDPENPSSVRSSIESARQNARMVRTAVTAEVWGAMNGCYIDVKSALARRVNERDLPNVLGLIRQRTALVRGATHGTMLRNDCYNFARIGTFLERADNTARILDTKYYVLLPTSAPVGSHLDNIQWETILRSVSGTAGFRKAYGQNVKPSEIVGFLVLDKRMPRSLNFCCQKIRENLGYLASEYGQRLEAHQMADDLCRRFMSHDVEAIFDYGLHEYIQDVVAALNALGHQIEQDYR